MDADGYLATAAQSGQRRALGGNGKTSRRMIKERNSVDGGLVALAGFNAQRSLTRGRTKILRIEFLAQPIGLAQPLKAGGRQQDRFHLALGKLAQARVHIAAKLDGVNVGPQSLQLGATPLAAGSHLRALRQLGQMRVVDGNKGVSADRPEEESQPGRTAQAVRSADP